MVDRDQSVSILSRPRCRLQVRFHGSAGPAHQVSILSRPRCRLQVAGKCRAEAAAATGVSILSRPRCRLQGRRDGRTVRVSLLVSILSRPRCRLQASAHAQALRAELHVSILSRPRCRLQAVRQAPATSGALKFQSSAGHVAGCKSCEAQSRAVQLNISFNPQPATLPAASSTGPDRGASGMRRFQSSAGHVAGCKRRRPRSSTADASFNPQPATLPAASAWPILDAAVEHIGFNPQPATLPAARGRRADAPPPTITFQSSAGHVAGCKDRGRYARSCRSTVVSILSRPRCRLQVAGPRARSLASTWFQSSAGHVAGCKAAPAGTCDLGADRFQSSAGHVAGCKRRRDGHVHRRVDVSILSRPRCRLQARPEPGRLATPERGFNPQPATLPAASWSSGVPRPASPVFQSSAGHVAGCKRMTRPLAREPHRRFNPQPATLPAASGDRAAVVDGRRGFNPQPATLPAASGDAAHVSSRASGFNPQPATLPAASVADAVRRRRPGLDVSILSRPRCRLQAASSADAAWPGLTVSILSRPRCRLQGGPAISTPDRHRPFQSSAGHVAGCKGISGLYVRPGSLGKGDCEAAKDSDMTSAVGRRHQ